MVVFVNKSPNADSRTANSGHVSFEEFSRSTDMHRNDVRNVMNGIASMIIEAGKNHDWTKKATERQFYEAFTAAKEQGKSFKDDPWYKYHVTNERHHLMSRVPDDVNLIDVFEYISDCCCAGIARSGKIYDLELSDEVLHEAFKNTVDLIKNSIKLLQEE